MRIIKCKYKILIPIFICGLLTMERGLMRCQAAQLNVPTDLRTETITFNPQGFEPSAVEGRFYYDSNAREIYYHNGITWKSLGIDVDLRVATKIVSAYNSKDAKEGNGTDCEVGDDTCYNPKADYTCDGTNDQDEINNAINSLPSAGGAVYLLEGTYNISNIPTSGEMSTGICLHSNTALIGTGAGTVLKITSGASMVKVINAQSLLTPVENVLVSQLKIDGNNKTGSNNYGICLSSVTYSKIDKVWVENINGAGIYIFNFSILSPSGNHTISNSHIRNNGGSSLLYPGAIYLSGSSNNLISGNQIQNNSNLGIYLLSSSNNNTISGNNIQSNGEGGIYIYNSSQNNLYGNNIQGNTSHGVYIYFSPYTSTNNIISDNNIQGNTNGRGIYLYATGNNIISGNQVQNNGYEGILVDFASSGNTITGNMLYNNGVAAASSSGITLSNNSVGSDGNFVSSNFLSDSAGTGYGINIGGVLCENNYLVANYIEDAGGYAGRLIIDSASATFGYGTKYTDKLKISWEYRGVAVATGDTLQVSQDPKAYVALGPSGFGGATLNSTTAISNGRAVGDMLILEGAGTFGVVTVPNNANTKLYTTRTLMSQSVLVLIWNGSDWVELAYSQN